jgi:hypothetical protein
LASGCSSASDEGPAHLRGSGGARAHCRQRPGTAGCSHRSGRGRRPEGAILGPIDRFLFGEWLPQSAAGAYRDGGITDYHLHLNYGNTDGVVLYPHFQRAVVPGWLDEGLKWRHKPTRFLERTVVLAPDPEWVCKLPDGKLPDRNDFLRYGNDSPGRIKAWGKAAQKARRLADELAEWLHRGSSMADVQAL